MNNQTSYKNDQLDDQLAEFTDRLLNQNIQVDVDKSDTDNQTLVELQQTVIRLSNAFGNETISEASTQKIKREFLREWGKSETETQKNSQQKNWWGRITEKIPNIQFPQRRKPAFSLAIASFAIVILVISVSLIFPDTLTGDHLPGSALGQGFPLAALVVLGLVLGVVFLVMRNRSS